MDRKDIIATSEPYIQIHPQHAWHDELIIQGNFAGLRKLAEALLKAADADAVTCREVFASDGEGYDIFILREERPAHFREPFYTVNVECHDPAHQRHSAAGDDEKEKP